MEHQELTGEIIGAAIAVHRALGPGFVETIYENALGIELRKRGMPFARQLGVDVVYEGEVVGTHRLDLFVANEIVVELKSTSAILDAHFIVVRSYLAAIRRGHGLILDFGPPKLQIHRVCRR